MQTRFLSGRAKVESLTKHWDKSHKDGFCLLCREIEPTEGIVEHLLLPGGCSGLNKARQSMISMMQVSHPYLLPIFQSLFSNNDLTTVQFLLDRSILPDIIKLNQESEDLILKDIFYLTRSYVFEIFVTRRRLLSLSFV